MFRQSGRDKIKNTKIQAWRAELGNFEYDIIHRPGKITLCPMHCLAPLRLHQLLLIRLKAHCPILLACTNNLITHVLLGYSILCALETFHFQLLMSAKFVAVAASVMNSNLPLSNKVK